VILESDMMLFLNGDGWMRSGWSDPRVRSASSRQGFWLEPQPAIPFDFPVG
jgi:hypothetical protein